MAYATLANYLFVCLILIYIAFQDVLTRTIQHRSLLALFIGLVFLMCQQNQLPNVIFAGLTLVAGFALFCCGVIGGGDVKLISLLALTLSNALGLQFLFLISIFGGCVAMTGMLFFRTSVREHGVPYATAIAAAFVFINPSSHLFLMLLRW